MGHREKNKFRRDFGDFDHKRDKRKLSCFCQKKLQSTFHSYLVVLLK